MNQYLICETGYGDGCDYTIGCNQRWRIEDFDGNLEEATKYFTNKLIINEEEDYYIEKGILPKFSTEGSVAEMLVVPLDKYDMPNLDGLRAEYVKDISNKIDKNNKIKQDEADRVEFERLSRKFKK